MLLAELRQEPALLRVLRKRSSSGKASSDAGPELAGRESCAAMESPQALMCPLEKGVRGIEISWLCRCPAYTIIVMLVLYASRKQVELQRACACGGPEIHGGKSSLSAPVVLQIELHGCRTWVFAPVVLYSAITLSTCRLRPSSL